MNWQSAMNSVRENHGARGPVVVIALVVILGLFGGCGPAFRVADVRVPSLAQTTVAGASEGAIEVTVTPITLATFRDLPQMPRARATVTQARSHYDIITLPPPAFVVRIVNRTGHVVRLQDAVFRLDDAAHGARFRALESTSELGAWASAFYGAAIRKNPQVAVALSDAIASIPLLTRDTVLLNDDDTTFVVAFDIPVRSLSDYEAFLRDRPELSLRLAELPVALDAAGGVTRAIDLRFGMAATTEVRRMLCRVNVTPSIVTCESFE